jgi:hypothetical protein
MFQTVGSTDMNGDLLRPIRHGGARSAEGLTAMRLMFYLAQQPCQLIEIDRLANMMIEARGRR